jgi:Ala-tRNA(Pro) deacylase
MSTCLERLTDLLRERGIPVEIQQHRLAYTAQETAAALQEKGRFVAKVFMALADDRPVMFVLPANARVDLDRARAVVGARSLRSARETEFRQLFPDCEVGAMPPFGNFYDVPVFLEADLAHKPYLVFPAGQHEVSMKLAMADYLRLVEPTVVSFEVEPAPEDVAGEPTA